MVNKPVVRLIVVLAGLLISNTITSAQVTVQTSNLSNVSNAYAQVTDIRSWAQGFTTTTTGPFILKEVSIILGSQVSGAAGFTLELYDDLSGLPGSSIETLVNPTITADTTNTFTSTAMTVLSPDIPYWIVASTSAGVVDWIGTGNLNQSGPWSIGDDIYMNEGTGFGKQSPNVAFQMSIGVVPEPSTYALVIGGACLAFVIWSRRRKSTFSEG